MLRVALGIMVAANLLFWIWSSGFGADDEANGTDDANRLRRQVSPERMHLMPPSPPGGAASAPSRRP